MIISSIKNPPILPTCVHNWYSFVLSFPPGLVETYLEKFSVTRERTVLDPFCGTGTTLVTAKALGIPSIGIESNPMAFFASVTKLNWDISRIELLEHARQVVEEAQIRLRSEGLDIPQELPLFRVAASQVNLDRLLSFSTGQWQLIPRNAISPIPLHKVLVLLGVLNRVIDERFYNHELLALARVTVAASNLRFGPEVGLGSVKQDAPVLELWSGFIEEMARDVAALKNRSQTMSQVFCGDSRRIDEILDLRSVDVVITSPPYPNEKDYTRTTRLESVLLGFISNKAELRAVKRNLVRSNTRGVFKSDTDDAIKLPISDIEELATAIEARRKALDKTSGFERLYARLTKLYFGGMFRHLVNLRPILRPGARLAYVVGDQASYFQVMIRTGQLFGKLAVSLGYELEGIDLFRTRAATATRSQLREEVVLLRWPGE